MLAAVRMKSLMLFAVVAGVGCSTGGGTLQGSAGAGGGSQVLGIGNFGGGQVPITGAAAITGQNCGGMTRPASLFPPDVVIVLDASASMNDALDGSCTGGCPFSKWWAAISAIDAVVTTTTAAVNWGLASLPDFADGCDAGSIAVPVGLYTAARIDQEIARRDRAGTLIVGSNSPMRAGVNVAAAHLSARPPGGRRIILMLTDGEPDCAPGATDTFASDATGTVQAITSAASQGIATAVFGIATAGGPADATLIAMAQAGDPAHATSSYLAVADRDGLAAAMGNLIAGAKDCTLAIPDPPTTDGSTDRWHIGLLRLDTNTEISFDPTHTNGWDYTDDSKMGAQLYGPPCDQLRAGTAFSVIFRCHD